jgi:LysR family transcriptional activator for leuABCD operon
VRNELPSAVFIPETSTRLFTLLIGSPHDIRFAPKIMSTVSTQAPNIQLRLEADFDSGLANRLRYQEVDFVIDYTRFEQPGFCSTELFKDELVVVASKVHPRINGEINVAQLMMEKHAKLSQIHGVKCFTERAYNHLDCVSHYEGTSLSNVLYVVSQSELVTIAPRWLVAGSPNREQLQILTMPFDCKEISGYLSWHESSEKDKGHYWLKEQLMLVCHDVVAAQ